MPDVAGILGEAEWLTRLARSLTGSAADADDVVQDTFVAALRSPPDPDRPVRPWLRRVATNIVRMRHRGRVRRDAREAVIDQVAEPTPTPEQLLERARIERTLTELVLALEEPYRTTILLRYREGLTAEAIAKRDRVPAGTVRRRLKTGVDRLRAGMDDSSKTWRAAFAPFLAMRGRRTPWWRLVMAKAMTKTSVAVIVLLLLALGTGGFWWLRARHATQEPPASQPMPPPAGVPGVTMTGLKAASVFAQSGLGTRTLSGRVTFEGKPFAGATVRVIHALTRMPAAELESAGDGTFVFAKLPADAFIAAAAAGDKTAMPVTVDLRAPKVAPVELELASCSHLRGVVTDGSAAPIAHAQISRDETAWPVAETNALGRYDLCTHFGEAKVRFTASGYQGVTATVTIAAATQRDMVLLPEATLAGTVVTGDGKPVADAWITVDPRGKTGVRNAVVHDHSAADGTFRISGVAAGRNELYAVAPGLASRRIGVVVGTGETKEGIVVRLDRAVRLTGRVVSNGAPVAGVGIRLRVGNLAQDDLAVTQADGSFTIERAPRGELGVVVDHYTVISPRTVQVGDADAHVEIVAALVGRIVGTVTRRGAPAADVVVSCPQPLPMPVTDHLGAFTCEMSSDGPFALVAEDADGRWGMASGTLARGATAIVTIDLAQAGQICGTVSDESGGRLRGIAIHASTASGDDTGDDLSGDDGTFCVRYLGNAGTFQITAFAGGRRVEPSPPLPPVELVDGRAEIAVVIPAPKLAISGTVVDAFGAPVADAAVRARVSAMQAGQFVFDSAPTTVAITDEDGHFAIERLSAGSYSVLATAREGAEQRQDAVAAGRDDVRLVLATAGRIEGTLVGFTTTPIVLGILSSGGHEPVDLEVDGDHFAASGLSPGPYVLSANTGGTGDAKRVVVTSGKTTTVVLTSRGTATITGHVLDWKSHEPVAGARCTAPVARDGDEIGVVYVSPDEGAISDASGAYRLDGVGAGEVIVDCHDLSVHGLRFATVPRGSTARLDVYTVADGEAGTIDARFHMETRRFETIEVGGQAAKAGLELGDEVLSVDGMPVTELTGSEVMTIITSRGGGHSAVLGLARGTATVVVRTADN
ncbi:MAG: sigma-70 family RNA polymerase sigma factor [Kofleriaceae bacterium]